MDEEALFLLERRVARAKGSGAILRLLDEAEALDVPPRRSWDEPERVVHRPQAVRLVMRHTPWVNRAIVKRAWTAGSETACALLENPALGNDHARWLIEAALEQMLRGVGARGTRQSTPWEVLRTGYRLGLIAPGDPVTEKLTRMLGTEPLPARAHNIPSSATQSSLALAACPTIAGAELRRVAQVLMRKREFAVLREALLHPNANATLWRGIARYVSGADREELAYLVALVPGARRDPETRRHLFRAAHQSIILALLCLDAGTETPRILARLAQEAPERVPYVLNHEEFISLRLLDPSDLMVLLDHRNGEVRMAAMRAYSRLQLLLDAEKVSAPSLTR